jgi:hypothetical protein
MRSVDAGGEEDPIDLLDGEETPPRLDGGL